MKRMRRHLLAAVLGCALGLPVSGSQESRWPGVDETVVEKFAEAAGRPARPPLINTDQGDLLLFCFLVAGMAGGFVMGYYFRVLFPPRRRRTENGATPSDV